MSFRRAGHRAFGLVRGAEIVDLSARTSHPDLRSALAAGALADLRREAASWSGDHELSAVELEPPIPNPRKILCVGANYHEHRVEMGRPVSAHPLIFTRYADSLVGHGAPLRHPGRSDRFDYEGELAVIIGRPGFEIPKSEALHYVAGYACFNDGSVRDWQRHSAQFTPGKNFPRTGAFGPWIVTADEVPDPQALSLRTLLNGEEVQSTRTELMIFSVAEIVEYVSSFTPLQPGDVIATGTAGGVGDKRDPPRYLRPGDLLEVEIETVGRLSNRVAARDEVELLDR